MSTSKRIIVCWAMGITQHRDSVSTIRDVVNFMLLSGNIGRPGSGLSPIRGHSNVQGDRTMGIWHAPKPEFLEKLRATYGFNPPEAKGLGAVKAMRAMINGSVKVLFSLGGNLARSLPDSAAAESALKSCRLTVHVSTKLNRSHLCPGMTSVILPTLGRTDVDDQASGHQFITVEDSFGTVHRSRGHRTPPSQMVRSEVAIVAALGELMASDCGVPWADYVADYSTIRRDIAAVIPGFENFEQRVSEPGGFSLPHPPRDSRRFETRSGRAQFSAEILHQPYATDHGLILQSLRSHDQFNTTLYGQDDRYRGVIGRRVIFVNPVDIHKLGFKPDELVDIVAANGDGNRVASGFRLVEYETPIGNAAAYYPETNVLIDSDNVSVESGTPGFKSIAVRLRRAQNSNS